jgi:hypothetical protein
MYNNFIKPLEKGKKPLLTWRASFLLEFASPLVPCQVTTAAPMTLAPAHPFSHPSAHITLFTRTTSTITVFFVRDKNISKKIKRMMMVKTTHGLFLTCTQ